MHRSSISPFPKTFSILSENGMAQSVDTGLENRRSLVRSLAWQIFFPRIDDSHCNRIHSSLTAVHCFDNGYVRKQPVAWKEYCAEYWFKELQESMDRCTGRRDITEMHVLLKTTLNTNQSVTHCYTDLLSTTRQQGNASNRRGGLVVRVSAL